MNFLLLWVLLGITIIVMSLNNFQLTRPTVVSVPDSSIGSILYVCPIEDKDFDLLARQLGSHGKGLSIAFTFIVILWIAILLWTLYQSLLKDKFERKSYDLPIFLGKFLLFGTIIVLILMRTPNHYRAVLLEGSNSRWTLCENNTPGAKAVRANAVTVGEKIKLLTQSPENQ